MRLVLTHTNNRTEKLIEYNRTMMIQFKRNKLTVKIINRSNTVVIILSNNAFSQLQCSIDAQQLSSLLFSI